MLTLKGGEHTLRTDFPSLGFGPEGQQQLSMALQIPQQSITIQLTHDPVVFAQYPLGYWEGIRGVPVTCHVAVGVGPGLTTMLNVVLQPRFDYYINTASPLMQTEFAPVAIPGVTSIAPVVVDILATPSYPGLARLRLTAQAGGLPILIHSTKGSSYEFDIWFYIIEREAAILVALTLPKQQ